MTPDEPLRAIAAAPQRAGLVLDFDGTLAPIVSDPTASALPAGAAAALEFLAQHLALVAIVSGRPAAFLGDRAAIPGVRLLGLYGTEQWADDRVVVRPEAAAYQPALDEARERITLALAGQDGVLFEDKGLALGLHWRNAPDRGAAEGFVTEVATAIAADTGLAHERGKFVVELRPPLDWDKGSSLTALVTELSLDVVTYIGDDRGDLPALQAAAAAGGFAMVVDSGPETPDEVRRAAHVVFAGTQDVHDWLRQLADRLS